MARALAWHARGRRFDPDTLHNPITKSSLTISGAFPFSVVPDNLHKSGHKLKLWARNGPELFIWARNLQKVPLVLLMLMEESD